jgi:hypothetical protein
MKKEDRMLRRRRIIVLAAVLVMAGAATACWCLRPAPTLLRQKYNQVRVGMAEEEALRLFGHPEAQHGQPMANGQFGHVWWSEDGKECVSVWCDDSGRVTYKTYAPEGPWERLGTTLRRLAAGFGP